VTISITEHIDTNKISQIGSANGNANDCNLSRRTAPRANLFRLKLRPIPIGFRDPNPRSLGKP